jgi:mono/diheme cytochrome c family protein
MLKRLFALICATAVAMAVCQAQEPTGKVVIPVKKSSPWDGKQMYGSYCAPCHGTDGRGNGPAAPALKTPPTDLSLLARNNHGKYPDTHVLAVLKFGVNTPAHGNAQMPVWGPILTGLDANNTQEERMRIFNLMKYLETLQVK